MVAPHQLIELACRVSRNSPHEIIYCRLKRIHSNGRYLAYYLLRKYARLEYIRIAELFDVTPAAIRQALETLDRKQNSTNRDDVYLCKMICECEEILK